MRIDRVDFFYLSMPEVHDVGDGSQDALLVRVVADSGQVGWGECEAAPLPTIASLICPMSHSACKPVAASVVGQTLDDPRDIARIGDLVHENSFDLLQADHALSGIDIALWDLLGRVRGEPIWHLLGWPEAFPKLPYASLLFGDDAAETLAKARRVLGEGYRAVKFGWGPYGKGTVRQDEDQVAAAREGIGEDGLLLVDAGTVWGDDLDRARLRLPSLKAQRALWLEEPFVQGALEAYRSLARDAAPVKIAGGEGSHTYHHAEQMIRYGGVGFIQIDTGRIGGITPAHRVAELARRSGVHFVNHTFTSHLALSASLQPYAGVAEHALAEYPVEPQKLALDMTRTHLTPDAEGLLQLPVKPGLGIEPDLAALGQYLVDVEIRVGGTVLYRTPAI